LNAVVREGAEGTAFNILYNTAIAVVWTYNTAIAVVWTTWTSSHV
jgi:hypothetical protein